LPRTTVNVVIVEWETVRNELPQWAMNAVIIFLAVAPLPGQLATRDYQASYLLTALFFLVLLARRRFPSTIIVASAGRAVLSALPPHGGSPIAVFGQLLLLFAIAGAARPEWVAWAGWAAGLAGIAAREITGQPRADYGWSDFFLTSAFCSALFAGALLVSRRTRAHRQMAERAKRAEAERERSAAEAVAAERARITREMHDVVAHSLTVAVVQCVAAADDLDSGTGEQATIARRVRAAESACRDALDELRRMLGVLRFGTEPLAPAPRLVELTDLTRAIGATGITVQLNLDGDLDGLPPGVELSCYRIVQEALTNILKHSGASTAHVSISSDASDVRVRVADDGRGADFNGLGGHGLISMRERAAAYGGTLSAGPQPAGGYLVEAVLPCGERR
jgi:signal transduction histidine kinase